MGRSSPLDHSVQRRSLLKAAAGGASFAIGAAVQGPVEASPAGMKAPGAGFSDYGGPSPHEAGVRRESRSVRGYPLAGSSWTPLHRLEGTITPNGLHFERHHNGVPDIKPGTHRLVVHGMVRRPLVFTIDSLHRYPMESHIHFIECAGNSALNCFAEPPAKDAGELHGLLSVSQWTGVSLATILEEAGMLPGASWVIAEGADGAGMARSIPLEKCRDDALLALYQNGEALRPEQGYPLRLLLPGFEGNTQIKWLHRLNVVSGPAHSREETARYTQLLPDGRSRQFDFEMRTKSVILRPSFGLTMRGPGFYEISGIAWSGRGRIRSVEVSDDGGSSWTMARLDEPVLPRSVTRFRLPWRWQGAPAVLMSRATDESGDVQPLRSDWIRQFGAQQFYHNNSIQAWSISRQGEIGNVYS